MSKRLKRFPREDKKLHSKDAKSAEALLFDAQQERLEREELQLNEFLDMCHCEKCISRNWLLIKDFLEGAEGR